MAVTWHYTTRNTTNTVDADKTNHNFDQYTEWKKNPPPEEHCKCGQRCPCCGKPYAPWTTHPYYPNQPWWVPPTPYIWC